MTDSITYVCAILGLLRAGVTVVPIATSNSSQGVAHLLAETKVTHVLVTNDQPTQELFGAASASLNGSNKLPPKSIHMPPFADLFSPQPAARSLPQRQFGLNYPVIIAHSSGSSSLPKPIPWTHASLLQVAATACTRHLSFILSILIPHVRFWNDGPSWRDFRHPGLFYGACRRFDTHFLHGVSVIAINHQLNIEASLQCSSGYTAAVLPPGLPYVAPSPESVLASYKECGVTVIKCVPSYLEVCSVTSYDINSCF
jgi:acyl-CoA synthetase (AMP-forming)/AMP-acid ligase II